MKAKVTAQFKERHGRVRGRARACVPSQVRDWLEAQAGDRLVFEIGNMHTAERAALGGRYLIVRLERAPEEVATAEVTADEGSLEPFAEIVQQRLQKGSPGVGDKSQAGAQAVARA
jgi:hypothetical protein